MATRKNGDTAVWVWLSADERAVIDRLRQLESQGGDVPSLGQLCRIAIASLADENGIDIPNGGFERTRLAYNRRRSPFQREGKGE